MEILRRIATGKTARTLRLFCVFCNSMEYSATCDVLILQVMYKLRSLRKQGSSLSCSEWPLLGTAITFVKNMVLNLGMCLCLSNSHTLFLLKMHFRSLNIRIGMEFNIILPSESWSKFFSVNISQYAYYIPIPSRRTLYLIILTQSAVNTQSS